MSLLDPQDWSFPVPIAYGPGRLKEIAGMCRDAGMSRPLVVTDRGSAGLPFLSDLMRYLSEGGLHAALYAEISPNPRDDEIAGGKALYRDGGHDGVIAIGGGSGMDGGKAIALTATNEIDLWAFEFEQTPPDMSSHAPFPPLITIPTTAGTGAETESTAMITDTAKGMKWCIWHADLKPALALLDPEITLGLPPHLTAWTGADAMVHAIEAYSVPGFHPLCDGLALEGLRLVARWLPVAVAEPGNLEARGGMLAGSCLAGVAFMKGLGLVHAISHMVGAEYDTQHGLTNAVLLPAVLRFNAPDIVDKAPAMAQAMGLEDTGFDAFHAHICGLLDRIGIPKTLADIGVPADCAPRIAAKAIQDSAAGTNPRALTVEQIVPVIEEAVTRGR
ncbi:iron-containing alcohol dehydrogenase [Nioella sediminis]|jgi:alcohol dehydrogenase class IV|uniref:iron-containing alcohol dehydrogenase n=1 Tax=Nioella sediminis TaxID=1912092 RepID=UPI0008FD6DDD|nr:iron-containing alcohol dehydrogenase [Nioella sediminis]TBX25962.1 dehydrogenase [Roseovarius sp. JS7-11]